MSIIVRPAVTLLNDWPHISRKWKEGHFKKKMRNRDNVEGLVKLMLDDLRLAPTRAAFDALKTIFKDVLYEEDEEDFADYFIKTYLTAPWDNWFLGASPAGVGATGQQLIENSHRGDKAVLGKLALRASPQQFLKESLPTILSRASDTLDNHPVDKVSFSVSKSFTRFVSCRYRTAARPPSRRSWRLMPKSELTSGSRSTAASTTTKTGTSTTWSTCRRTSAR